MIKKSEDIIKNLLECQGLLQKQIDAQHIMIDTKDQQIKILEEQAAFLKSRNNELSEGITQMIEQNERLEGICVKQQVLLDEFSKMME